MDLTLNMDPTVKQQLTMQKQLYMQRLDEIVSLIKQAAQQTMGQYDEVYLETLKNTLTSDREMQVATLLEQKSQLQAQVILMSNQVQEFQKENHGLRHQLQKYKQLASTYKNKATSMQMNNRQDSSFDQMRYRIELLEQQLSAKNQEIDTLKQYNQKPKISRDEHELAMQNLDAKYQAELQNLKSILEQQHLQVMNEQKTDQTKQIARLTISTEKKIAQYKEKVTSLQLQLDQIKKLQQSDKDMQDTCKKQMEEIHDLNREIMQHKNTINQLNIQYEGSKVQNEKMIKYLKDIRKELQNIQQFIAKIRIVKSIIFQTDDIDQCLYNIQRNMITQSTMRTISNCFYEVMKEKQELFNKDISRVLQEIEEDL